MRPATVTRLAGAALVAGALAAPAWVAPARAAPFFFSTGSPDGKIGTASRPETGSAFEIETADDFLLPAATSIGSATFTGLIPTGSHVNSVTVEIYRVFPADSNVARTGGPPLFPTPQVPARLNSPSDVEFVGRDSGSGTLSFSTTVLDSNFTVANSVRPGGIHPLPNVNTGGDGPATGEEVEFDVTFGTPLALPADHYFFVPQVELDTGDFLWLSAPKPIQPPGTPFIGDLQSWTRDMALDPDWLRIGTDIVGAGPFNAAFSLSAAAVPEPPLAALALLLGGPLLLLRRRDGRS